MKKNICICTPKTPSSRPWLISLAGDRVIKLVLDLLPQVNRNRRTMIPASELVMAVQCAAAMRFTASLYGIPV